MAQGAYPRLVVPHGEGHPDTDEGPAGELDDQQPMNDPAKVVRLATMAQVLLTELRDLDLDEAARERLASIYNDSVDALADVLSEELREELEDLGLEQMPEGEHPPTSDELHVVQTQLVGWLQGLFQGIRAALTTHHLARREQLARMYADALESGAEPEGPGPPGSYL